jgi:hypothetical protein
MNVHDVETWIRTTLLAVAETTDRMPQASPETVVEPDEPELHARPNVRAIVLAAVSVVVLCLVGSVAVVATNRERIAVDARAALDVPRAEWRTTAAPLLAPTWLPPNLHLFEMSSAPAHAFPSSSDMKVQLFGRAARSGDRVTTGFALSILKAKGIAIEGTTVRVRGRNARVDHEAGGVTFLSWMASDEVEMSATSRGIALDRVIATINALRPRSTQPIDGFDPASASAGLPLLGESLADGKSRGISDLRYAPALNASDLGLTEVIVRTTTAGSNAEYLAARVSGVPAGDAAVEVDSFTEVSHGDSGTTRAPIVRMFWSDGRSIEIQGGFGIKDLPTLRRIARSAQPFDSVGVERLRTGVDQRIATLGLWASATVDGFVLELRGDTVPLAVCLRLASRPPACAPLQGQAGPGLGDVLIGAQWIVFAAQEAAPPRFDVDGKTISARRTETRGWHLALAALGANAMEVDVSGVTSVRRPR